MKKIIIFIISAIITIFIGITINGALLSDERSDIYFAYLQYEEKYNDRLDEHLSDINDEMSNISINFESIEAIEDYANLELIKSIKNTLIEKKKITIESFERSALMKNERYKDLRELVRQHSPDYLEQYNDDVFQICSNNDAQNTYEEKLIKNYDDEITYYDFFINHNDKFSVINGELKNELSDVEKLEFEDIDSKLEKSNAEVNEALYESDIEYTECSVAIEEFFGQFET